MKMNFRITYAIDDLNNPIESAVISVDYNPSNCYFIKDLAKLAFEKVEQKYPNNKLFWIDYNYLYESYQF